MGYSQAEKAATHQRIVELAARRFREAGIDGIGVAALMKEAGLTHGGFYRHFESRDALVAEAVEFALDEGRKTLTRRRDGDDPFATLVDRYLSRAHRDTPAQGCTLVALASDAARAGSPVRESFARQIERYLTLLEGMLEGADETRRKKAVLILSSLVGALAMARAVGDESLSQEFLEATAAELKALVK